MNRLNDQARKALQKTSCEILKQNKGTLSKIHLDEITGESDNMSEIVSVMAKNVNLMSSIKTLSL